MLRDGIRAVFTRTVSRLETLIDQQDATVVEYHRQIDSLAAARDEVSRETARARVVLRNINRLLEQEVARMETPQSGNEMLEVLDSFLSSGCADTGRVWDVLTALRSCDISEDYTWGTPIKDATTCRIRALALPKTIKQVQSLAAARGFYYSPSAFRCHRFSPYAPKIIPEELKPSELPDSSHFNRHYSAAKGALRDMGRS